MNYPPQELFVEIRRRHGHYCPMSTLGGRLGYAARQALSPGTVLRGCYYTATCAADGIAVALGGAELEVRDYGRHALWLIAAGGGGVLVELRPEILQRAAGYRALDLALEQDRSGLTSDELSERIAAKEEFLEKLLQQLRTLPDEDVMTFAPELPENLL